jgi:hypothetical protein
VTRIDDPDTASAATSGLANPSIAIGTATALKPIASARFSRIRYFARHANRDRGGDRGEAFVQETPRRPRRATARRCPTISIGDRMGAVAGQISIANRSRLSCPITSAASPRGFWRTAKTWCSAPYANAMAGASGSAYTMCVGGKFVAPTTQRIETGADDPHDRAMKVLRLGLR